MEDEEYHRLLIQKGAANAKAPTAQIDDEEVDQLEAPLHPDPNPNPNPNPHKVDQLEHLFKECDINGDGVVDFEEFRRVMELLSGQVSVRGRGRARSGLG